MYQSCTSTYILHVHVLMLCVNAIMINAYNKLQNWITKSFINCEILTFNVTEKQIWNNNASVFRLAYIMSWPAEKHLSFHSVYNVMVSGPTLRPEGVDHSPSRTTPKEPLPSFPHSISCLWLMRQVSDCSPLWREEGEALPPSSAILLAVPERICKRLTPLVIPLCNNSKTCL